MRARGLSAYLIESTWRETCFAVMFSYIDVNIFTNMSFVIAGCESLTRSHPLSTRAAGGVLTSSVKRSWFHVRLVHQPHLSRIISALRALLLFWNLDPDLTVGAISFRPFGPWEIVAPLLSVELFGVRRLVVAFSSEPIQSGDKSPHSKICRFDVRMMSWAKS